MDLSSPEKGGLFELDHFISLNKKQKGRNLQSCVRAECIRSEGNARPCSARPDSGPGCGEPHGARRGRAAALRFSRPGRRRPLGTRTREAGAGGEAAAPAQGPGTRSVPLPGQNRSRGGFTVLRAQEGADVGCSRLQGWERPCGVHSRPVPARTGPRLAPPSALPTRACAAPPSPSPSGRRIAARKAGGAAEPASHLCPEEPGRAGPPASCRPLTAPASASAAGSGGAGSRAPRELRGVQDPPLHPRTCREAPAPPARPRPRHVAPRPRALLTCAAAGRARCPPAALKPGPGSRGGAEPRPARLCWGPARSPRRPVPVPQRPRPHLKAKVRTQAGSEASLTPPESARRQAASLPYFYKSLTLDEGVSYTMPNDTLQTVHVRKYQDRRNRETLNTLILI